MKIYLGFKEGKRPEIVYSEAEPTKVSHPQYEPGYYAVSFCDPDNYVIEIYTRQKPKPL